MHKAVKGYIPLYFQELFQYFSHGDSFRLDVPAVRTSYGSSALSVIGPKVYNSLPINITDAETIGISKRKLKTYLFRKNEFEIGFE